MGIQPSSGSAPEPGRRRFGSRREVVWSLGLLFLFALLVLVFLRVEYPHEIRLFGIVAVCALLPGGPLAWSILYPEQRMSRRLTRTAVRFAASRPVNNYLDRFEDHVDRVSGGRIHRAYDRGRARIPRPSSTRLSDDPAWGDITYDDDWSRPGPRMVVPAPEDLS